MNNKEIIEKALKKVDFSNNLDNNILLKNGYRFDSVLDTEYLVFYDIHGEVSYHSYETIIYSNGFLKAFFGEKEIRGYNISYWLYSPNFPEPDDCVETAWITNNYINKKELDRYKNLFKDKEYGQDGYDFKYKAVYNDKSGWQYHAQQMVIKENPLEYLEQFLE